MSTTITATRGREILDSRGRPTVEAELTLSNGIVVQASVPSGASTGRHEAVEKRDHDPARRGGLGVRSAAASVTNEIAAALRGTPLDQEEVDRVLCELDGTADKSRLGANAILPVSLAVARGIAASHGVPLWMSVADGAEVELPLPMVNILSGGLHARRQLDFQDFLVVPVGAATFSHAVDMVCDVYAATGEVLSEAGLSTLHADEGGYGPALTSHAHALDILNLAVERAGLRLADDIVYALDVAATHFYDEETDAYRLSSEDTTLDAERFIAYLGDLADRYPIASIEDGLAEDDWVNWTELTAALGGRLQIVGDDLFTTNPARLSRGVSARAANAVLVKMNQIGTLTETRNVISIARAAGYRTVISARSGETEDHALADFAVGTSGGQIKIGSVTQSERLAKYNQLLRIEEGLGDRAVLSDAGSYLRAAVG